jgi:hypothetical protein
LVLYACVPIVSSLVALGGDLNLIGGRQRQ